MKILKYIALAFILLISSCQKEEIHTYQGVNNIYFSPAWVPIIPGVKLTDSLYVSFVFETVDVNELTIKIPVRVQGLLSNVDRKYLVEMGENSTAVEGVDMDAINGEHTFRAGQEVDTLEFNVYRTEGLKKEVKFAEINLLPNGVFSTSLKENVTNQSTGESINCLKFRVYFDDILGKPKYWSVGYLGEYSEKKMYLISEVMLVPLNIFSGDVPPSVKEVLYIGRVMQKYLDEQAANGTPVLEEDGTPMKMGNSI